MTLILGIDDAGRGPVLGPMILAGVLIDKIQEKKIKREGATDSKALTHPQRIRLTGIIKHSSHAWKVVKTFPEEIDAALNAEKMNLNKLEAQKAAQIIDEINKGKNQKERINVIIDCPSINTLAWKNTLLKYIKNSSNLTIKCEHKADINHTSASAASIIAKVAREDEVEKIRNKYKEYGDVGSGYPSDPITQAFLKKHGKELKNSGIFRKTWKTWKNLFPEESKDKKQKTLGEF